MAQPVRARAARRPRCRCAAQTRSTLQQSRGRGSGCEAEPGSRAGSTRWLARGGAFGNQVCRPTCATACGEGDRTVEARGLLRSRQPIAHPPAQADARLGGFHRELPMAPRRNAHLELPGVMMLAERRGAASPCARASASTLPTTRVMPANASVIAGASHDRPGNSAQVPTNPRSSSDRVTRYVQCCAFTSTAPTVRWRPTPAAVDRLWRGRARRAGVHPWVAGPWGSIHAMTAAPLARRPEVVIAHACELGEPDVPRCRTPRLRLPCQYRSCGKVSIAVHTAQALAARVGQSITALRIARLGRAGHHASIPPTARRA